MWNHIPSFLGYEKLFIENIRDELQLFNEIGNLQEKSPKMLLDISNCYRNVTFVTKNLTNLNTQRL
jgi:hypothetical protein